MAFICEKCHKRLFGNDGNSVHFSGSYGPCETCTRKSVKCHNCYYCVRKEKNAK